MDNKIWEILGTATINAKALRRLESGHPWIYDSDIVDLPSDEPGFVEVRQENKKRQGRLLGYAMFSPRSKITLRMVTGPKVPPTAAWLDERIKRALAGRLRALPEADAFRLIHGEADGLPGVYVDRYDDCVAVQTTCAAADRLEECVIDQVIKEFHPRAVVIRDDVGSRRREGLREHITVAYGQSPVLASFHEGTIALEVDLERDQKTGGFLDQSSNHIACGHYARGRALDCFTYHGGFALQMALGCDSVIAVDASATAVERGQRNAAQAGLSNIEWINDNAFDLLRRYADLQQQFDTIALDPPAFASTKDTHGRASNAYKEINLRALKLLAPGGTLVTCSCSGRITADDFDAIIAAAARDAHKHVQILERRGAGPDHPVLVGMPETEYLKCRILAVV
ncbi:MAG: hypothetical protein A2289_09720 [Deltaproteobacteria bacterium RIFOXYA12_FULL_58_15]|nr:MAG: hypothetical protein A2289_09720 [Deltaproteobacteria bacterium RIFOXYA12_FULL_58_15]OGR08758.1 MAG: hypothetical protein A2341_13750 [Deltaproteobacteria bacterium RIFOXYB12_FULL_58_9]